MPIGLALALLLAAPARADWDVPGGLRNGVLRLERRLAGEKEERKAPPEPKLPEGFLPVPLIRQTTEHACGPAVLLAVMSYWQVYKGSETALHAPLDTTEEFGTAPEKIVEVAKKFGLSASVKQGVELSDLQAAFKRGETILINFQAWREKERANVAWKDDWEDGHYAVLIGLDGHYAYLMDPWVGKYGYLPLSELPERWHDDDNRGGKRTEHHRLAVFIAGKTPLKERSPQPLVKIE